MHESKLTRGQTVRVKTVLEGIPGGRYVAEKDEPHDDHVFVRYFDLTGTEVAEECVEADGSIAG